MGGPRAAGGGLQAEDRGQGRGQGEGGNPGTGEKGIRVGAIPLISVCHSIAVKCRGRRGGSAPIHQAPDRRGR